MKETPYLHLPIYEDTDKQDLRDGYNRLAVLVDRNAQKTDTAIEQLKNKE